MSERSKARSTEPSPENILWSLSRNPRFQVVAALEGYSTLDVIGNSMRILVAPKTPILDAKKLQREMMRLLPFNPTMMDEFSGSEMGIRIGKLYFDKIGVRKVFTPRVVVHQFGSEPETAKTFTRTEEERIIRRVWVVLYPSVEIAEKVLGNIQRELRGELHEYNLEWFIPQEYLSNPHQTPPVSIPTQNPALDNN